MRPKQGTTRIQHSPEKAKRLLDHGAKAVLNAVLLAQEDTDVAALAIAKREQNAQEIGRLLGVLKERYGAGASLLQLFKNL